MRCQRVIHGMSDRLYCVYITSNRRRTVLYIGVTGDLKKRIWQHRQKVVDGFTSRFNADQLVYYETCAEPLAAIAREKQLKAGPRRKKVALIDGFNPQWRDLYDEI